MYTNKMASTFNNIIQNLIDSKTMSLISLFNKLIKTNIIKKLVVLQEYYCHKFYNELYVFMHIYNMLLS